MTAAMETRLRRARFASPAPAGAGRRRAIPPWPASRAGPGCAGRRPGRRPRGRGRRRRGRRRSRPGSGRRRRPGDAVGFARGAARETMTAHRAGWTTSTRSSQGPRRSRRTSAQRPVGEVGEGLLAGGDLLGEDRGAVRGARRPCRPLRALAGEDEGGPGRRRRAGRRARAGPLAGGQGVEGGRAASGAPRHHRAVLEGWAGWWPASRRRRRAVRSRVGGEVGGEAGGPARAGRVWRWADSTRGRRPSGAASPPLALRGLASARPGLLQDHVRVGAADPERGDAGAAGPVASGQGTASVSSSTCAGRPVDVRGGLVDVQGRRAGARAAGPAPS